ncbi:MAG: DNA double-strand break repair nuclease NurA [Thermogemmatispora sp.]|nr:DNA double-strand break repair nuclease NurA [Thermogemmatispora sp.]MBX5457950.1 DNA double-strand break repair nuclease NurA [Thermogemmatispora sp.]
MEQPIHPSERMFQDLPAALVEEALARTHQVGQQVSEALQRIRSQRETYRQQLQERGLIQRDGEVPYAPIPTTCGVDGAYAIERLLATDLVAAAAVAVEGLSPPSEQRYWEQPQHQVIIEAEPHSAESQLLVRACMMAMELSLAVRAPHEVVFLDGSLTTPLISLNEALTALARGLPPLALSSHLLGQIEPALDCYQQILRSERSDKHWVAAPKYTTRREIGRLLDWPVAYDDRGMLTTILLPGELTLPQPLQPPEQKWHLNLHALPSALKEHAQRLYEAVMAALQQISVVYYRPFAWLPALRIEVSTSIASSPERLALVIQALRHQCGTPSILEPYPLYLADRMVKSLASGIAAFRQLTSQQIAEQSQGEMLSEIFLALHGYRTDTGR